ncbi:DUF1499 domain-containing protein [Pseudovibrio exalbescens]|uniref:DUF1499 domain-containing protein n=1 Tax=Pseudovibrio exalbescens TaxID=197461 RepID=UPI0023661B16|nr:DUF1499 domain-containing protein [Pseudovibrio exalbescens]MDD7911178.1 DUF1499 domain-containing protein [Pseudovibrio exalbescens]
MIVSRLPLRISKAAWRSRQIGAVSIPTLVVAVLAHRWELINANTLVIVMLFGSALAGLCILMSLYAVVDLWRDGGKGFANAFWGFLYGCIALVPLAFGVWSASAYPNINDVSTDMVNPPPLTIGATASDRFTPQHQDLQKTGYPDVVPRRFRISPHELHRAAQETMGRLGWEIVSNQPPDLADEPSLLLAEVTTPVIAFKDDFSMRITPDRVGALMDIRSASRFGQHDLGANARHIREFLELLDSVLLETYGVTPVFEAEAAVSDDEPLSDVGPMPDFLEEDPISDFTPVPGLKPTLN